MRKWTLCLQRGVLFAAVAVCALGCFERQLRPVNPCTTSEVGRAISIDPVDTVDLLFLVDNSGSMEEEQSLLRAEIPRMITVLATGNQDADPEPEFTPVRSLHVGIISSDMGAGDSPLEVSTCDPGTGDDGILQNTARGADCTASFPSRIFSFERGGDVAAFAADVGCVADLGTGGCGFEQQLEATLKALSPATAEPFVSPTYVPPTFWGNTSGHAGSGGANEGFLRDGSVLAIVVLTDEEDCSIPDYGILDADAPEFGGRSVNLNVRCARYPDALHPVQRYIDGLLQLRPSPSQIVFAPIAGVPVDLAGEGYDAMLDDERLDVIEEDNNGDGVNDGIRASCTSANGDADPPRRMIEVARGLRLGGASTTVQSICAENFGPAIDVIIDRLVDALRGACLPRALNPRGDGTVGCSVVEVMPPGSTCTGPGLTFLRTETSESGVERDVCEIDQLAPAVGTTNTVQGWYYDDASPEVEALCRGGDSAQRIAFSLLDPPRGAEVRLNCAQAILPTSEGVAQLGSFCAPFAAPGPENLCSMGEVPSRSPDHELSCDPLLRSCGVRCTSSADCAAAGLLSYVCDDRAMLEVAGGAERVPDVDGDGDADDTDAQSTYGFCVNPTC